MDEEQLRHDYHAWSTLHKSDVFVSFDEYKQIVTQTAYNPNSEETVARRANNARSISRGVNPVQTLANWREDVNPQVRELCHKYTQGFRQNWNMPVNGFLFYGGTGTGKSYAAQAIANELIEQGYWVEVVNVTDLTSCFNRDENPEKILNRLSNRGLVVIDDIGAERSSDWTQELLYRVIDRLNQEHKPLIVTTNYNPNVLANANDLTRRRIYSRLMEYCHQLDFGNTDLRLQNKYV